VAITGMGLITAQGVGTAVNWQRVLAGEAGLRPVTLFPTRGYRATTAGQVAEVPPVPWRHLRPGRADRASALLYHAAAEALADARLPVGGWEDSCLVALGTTLGGMSSGLRFHEAYLRRGPRRTRPSRVVDHLAHAQPLHVMAELGIPGVPWVFGNACASGANAIGHAFRAVRAGVADVALCGGYDPLCEFAFAGFHALQALTSELCRPFDRRRSGLVLGEGAAVLVLEGWERAARRGARLWGEVAGYGESNDAFHMTRPDPRGAAAALAIRRALEDAGVEAREVGYVNAHGTGTPFNDASETAALLSALGAWASEIAVSSTKPLMGHLLGAAGAAEAILTVLALKDGRLPPSLNYETPDPACPLRILRTAEPADARVALSNSFGFGGANATLALRRAEA
jgi:3-oxoacyl-[acyl-carrier-protein] synthase II